MTDFPDGIVIEARKAGLKQAKRKAADGSWFDVHDVTFEIHPNDTNSPLSNMPLGTRVALVVTQLVEDAKKATDAQTAPEATQVPEEPERPKGGTRAKRAGILCNDPAFQNWYHGISEWDASVDRAEYTARTLRFDLEVESRADLDHNEVAGKAFDQIMSDFYASQRGETEEALMEQRR